MDKESVAKLLTVYHILYMELISNLYLKIVFAINTFIETPPFRPSKRLEIFKFGRRGLKLCGLVPYP